MNPARTKLGMALKSVREKMNMTLEDVSSRTGLAASTLSKVENGLVSLTYDKLVQLSEGLQLDFNSILTGELAEAGRTQPILTARRSVNRVHDGLSVETDGYDYTYLSHDISRKIMVPILIRLKAKSTIKLPDFSKHNGEEFFYVLSGEVEMRSEYYEPILLKVGESIYFDSNMKHVMLSAGEVDSEILDICANSGGNLFGELTAMTGSKTGERRRRLQAS